LIIIIYIYANISFSFMNSEYILQNDKGESQNMCENIFYCTLFHFNEGVRTGGGIGNALSLKSFSGLEMYIYRYIGDLIFFIFVVLLIMNMINGIIITTFGQLREDNEKKYAELYEKCLVCNLTKSEFEINKISFDDHVNSVHNIVNYLHYLSRLKMNENIFKLNSDQLAINKHINSESDKVSFFPYRSTLSLNGGKELKLKEIKEKDDDDKSEDKKEDDQKKYDTIFGKLGELEEEEPENMENEGKEGDEKKSKREFSCSWRE